MTGFTDSPGRLGFTLGVSMPIENNTTLFIFEPGFRYINRSFYDQSVNAVGTKTSFATKIDHLAFFSKAKFDVMGDSNQNMKFLPYLGAGLGVLINAECEIETRTAGGVVTKREIDLKEDSNSISIDIILGADILFNQRFTIGAEYNRILNSIGKDDTIIVSTFMINFGYLLRF
jgi:opacity protein-like surface antigen